MERFSDWLLNELKTRDMSQSDLARAAGLGRGTISNIMNGTRNVGQDTLTAIARALKLPPEHVFEKAGILPPKAGSDPWVEKMSHRLSLLDPQFRDLAERLIKTVEDTEDLATKEPHTSPRNRPLTP